MGTLSHFCLSHLPLLHHGDALEHNILATEWLFSTLTDSLFQNRTKLVQQSNTHFTARAHIHQVWVSSYWCSHVSERSYCTSPIWQDLMTFFFSYLSHQTSVFTVHTPKFVLLNSIYKFVFQICEPLELLSQTHSCSCRESHLENVGPN